MLTLIRQRTIQLGPLTLTVRMPDATAERITRSFPYRHVIRPGVMRLRNTARWILHPRLPGGRRPVTALLPAVAPQPEDIDRADLELRQRAAHLGWDQVVELTPTVVTPGARDHRPLRAIARLPESLAGLRCLDAARRDGFWAFELEARGAAEVVALDWAPYVDRPALVEGVQALDPRAYAFAREIKESTVRSVQCHPYDLDPSRVGKFDLIVVADVLSRLRNPEVALERLLSVCRGTLVLAEPFEPRFDRYGDIALLEFHVQAGQQPDRWWTPGVGFMKRALATAGFQWVTELGRWQAAAATGNEPLRMVVLSASTAEPSAAATRAAVGRHGINLMGARPRPPRAIELKLDADVALNAGRADRGLPAVRGLRAGQMSPPQGELSQPLADRLAGVDWYHTIELGQGVVTDGFVDHRYQLPLYQLPGSLAGKRCLDVATFDGYWSFELERRGAAEVVAADIEKRTDGDIPGPVKEAVNKHLEAPMGAGFKVAHEVLGSAVRHKVCNVYDLSPDRVGTFDFVFLSDLLLHIRDPQLALERVFSVCRGDLHVADVYLPGMDHYGDRCLTACPGWMPGSFVWWLPSVQTLKRMLSVAGFVDIRELGRFRLETLGGDAAKVVLVASVPAWKREQDAKAAVAGEGSSQNAAGSMTTPSL